MGQRLTSALDVVGTTEHGKTASRDRLKRQADDIRMSSAL